MDDMTFPANGECVWTAEDFAGVRAASDVGDLPAEVTLPGGHRATIYPDEAAAIFRTTGNGKNGALSQVVLGLFRAGKVDLTLIDDPKAAPVRQATAGDLAIEARPTGTVVIHQLTSDGVCWREFHHHPETEEKRQQLYARIERAYRMATTMVTLDGAYQFGGHGTHPPATSHRDTTTATVYRPPREPNLPWSLGLGFDDHLATLEPGKDAPLDAADAALAKAGLRRTGDWRAHFPRANWGWRTATVTRENAR